MSSATIVVPLLDESFPGVRPKWFLTEPKGDMIVSKLIASLQTWRDQRIVVGVLPEVATEYDVHTILRRGIGRDVDVYTFNVDLRCGQAELVHDLLQRARVSGPVFVKTSDSWFATEDVFKNCICCVARNQESIEHAFLTKRDRENLVTVGKHFCQDLVPAGGYGFTSADMYQKLWADLSGSSHSVLELVLNGIAKGESFEYKLVKDFVDVSDAPVWHRFRRRSAVFIVDLDGVVVFNRGHFIPPYWEDLDEAIAPNVEVLLSLQERGAQFVFLTARPECYRQKTEEFLRRCGLSWHQTIFGINHAPRILINDYANSNPHPSALAFNIKRDHPDLAFLLRDWFECI